MKCLKKRGAFLLLTAKNNNVKNLDYFRAEYAKQKKLENIINSRILVRPNIKKWQVAISFAILPFFTSLSVFLAIKLIDGITLKFFTLFFLIIILAETYLRFCLILLVKYYQSIAKEETRRRCKCIPSCSDYSILALKRIFPLIVALLKIRKRLFVTCNGDGYKIDFPIRKMGEDFENKL